MEKRIPFQKPNYFRITPVILMFGFLLFTGSQALGVTKTSIGTTWNVSGNWSPSGIPVAGDDIIINTNMTSGPPAALTFASITVNTGFSFTHTGTAIVLSGNLLVDGTYTLTSLGLTVNGTTTVNGTLNDNNNTGANIFVGQVLVGPLGTISSANSTWEFRNGLDNDGTVSLTGASGKSFTTNSQSLEGGGNITLNAVTLNAGITLTNNNTGITTFNGAFALNGTFTDGTDGGSNVFGGLITIPTGGNLNTANNSDYSFGGGITTTGTGSVTLTGTGTVTFTATQNINQLGPVTLPNVNVPAGITLGLQNTANFTNNGATNVDGTFTVTASGGLKLFVGLVTVSGTGSFSNNNTAAFEFRGGITNNGTFSLTSSAAKTFSTNSQALAGTGNIAMTPVTINSGITLTNNSTGTTTLSGVTTLNGTFTDGNDGGSNVFSGTLNIGASGALNTSFNSNYTFSGTGGISNAGSISLTGTGTITFSASQTISGVGAITLSNVLISTGTTTWTNTGNLTVNGTTTINGGFSTTATSGSRLFTGLKTIGATGSFTCATTAPFEYQGGITVTSGGTYSHTGAGAGLVNFSTNPQTLTGTLTIANGNISAAAALTVNGTLNTNATGSFTGVASSSLVIGIGGILNWSSTSNSPVPPPSTLIANGSNATVNYNGAGGQSIRSVTYFNLGISGSGVKSLFADPNISNNLTISGGTLRMNNVNLSTVNLTLSGNGILDNNPASPTTCALTVAGNLTMSGTSQINNMNGPVNPEFQGDILTTSSGSLIFPSGSTAVFSTNNLAINGSGTITFGGSVIIADGITVTSTKTVTITGTLDASVSGGQWVNDSNSNLILTSGTQPFNTTGNLIASASPNTVTYNGSAQTIRNTTYHHLTIQGSGTKTITDFTVNGNFTQTGGTLSCSGTQSFASATNSSISVSGGTLNDVVVNKPGATLSLSSSLTISGALTVSAGTLGFGSPTARTLTVNGDLGGNGTIDLSAVANHALVLNGATNSIGTLTTTTGNNISYNRVGNQTLAGNVSYSRLLLGGSGTKTFSEDIEVRDTLFLTADVLVELSSYNLTLSAGARLKAGVLNGASGNFSANRMVMTNGTGLFIKEATTEGHINAFSWSLAAKNGAIYPIGTSGVYSPYLLSSFTATVTPTASLSIRAVPQKQPNVPYFNNALAKYWEISTTNISSVTATMTFTFNAAEVIGSVSFYVPRVWDGSTLSAVAGASAPGSNPFSTTGTTFLDGSWTAIDPTVRNAYYSYISGDWNTAGTWTTDPSGTTLINSAIPTVGDQVYILNGRTVTNSASGLTTASLTIENGGILDLGTSSGHNFGPVSGTGTYRQSGVILPAGNFTAFTGSTGGTFEYYDLAAGTYELDSTLTTYNNLLITNSTGSNFILALDTNLTVNGNFSISRTGAGTASLLIGNTTQARTVNFLGDLTVGEGTMLGVGTFNSTHTVNVYGNMTNSGTVTLNNAGVAYTNPTTGSATLNFRGTVTKTTLVCNAGSSTKFAGFNVIKNTGYELFVSAATGASPLFWANGKTLDAVTGTLRLGANISVPRMTNTGGNYDLGTSSTIPTLWIDGATVTFADGGGAIVPYGTLRISAGTLNVLTGQGGIVLRETGQLIIEGTATVNAKIFRTSTTATTHRGSYTQTGGTFNIDGTNGGINYYAMFALPYADNFFRMTGGTINITRAFLGGICPNGGIHIGSTSGNYDVTGGTINVTAAPGLNFDIASSAPLYNLNIYRGSGAASQVRLNSIPWSYDGSGPNTVTYPAQPLVVLNEFNVFGTNSPVFNAQTSNVSVRGNMTVHTGGTFQSTTHTLIFDGSGAQTFTVDGSLNTGLSSLTVNKSSSTLSVAGTAGTITVRGNLTISAGTLADGGKTINVAQNVTNNGTHSGAGKIALNGTTSQTISGTATSVFGNLDFSNTAGAAGSTQITVSSNLQINGNLGLTTDRVTNIGNKQIVLSSTSSITGTFSANRHIKTNGLLSDGGIRKTFSSTASFTFPLGYGSNYSPATIQFTSAPTTWGSLDVRPVGTKQLYVTDPNCFDLYWKIKTTGFSGIPANSVNYTFNYGSLTDDASYIPAFYDQLAIAYVPINDVTQVDESTNNILFTGVSTTDGDYTAGNPAAFGVVVPFYSRTNGNWNTPSTWSNVTFGGTAATGIPAANSPVLIGDGNLFNHTVTVTTNGTISGSLIVDAGSTLDCQTTTGNNFGAIPYATAGGSGTIRISSAAATAEFPAGDFGLFFGLEGGTCEYYSTGTQDFTLPSATASPNVIDINTYKNLVLAPGSGRTITMPDKDYLIYNNLRVNGHSSGIAYLTNGAARVYTINNNLVIDQGILELGPSFSQTVNVLNNTSIANGGTLQTASSGSAVHNLNLDGNLTNEGVISLNNASKANLTFQNPGSKVFDGSNGSASVILSSLIINKGTSIATELDITTQGTFSTPSDNWLTLTNGTLKWSRSGTVTLSNAVGDYSIPSTAGLTLNNAGLTVNVAQVNSSDADLVLSGKLSILAGTMNIGVSANNQHNDLEYGAAGSPEVEVTGSGVLNVNGQIRRSLVVQLGALKYTQSGTSVVTVRGKNPDAANSLSHDRAKFEILNSGSEFNMSGSSILTIDRTGAANGVFYDVYLNPGTFNVTGGEVRIGTSSTINNTNFVMDALAPFWNLTVDGTTTAKVLTLTGDPITVQKDLRIEGGSRFVASGLNVTIGGDLINQNTSSSTGLSSGGYQPTSATQVTTFNGTTASQSITGVSGNLTNFAVLTLQNTFSGGELILSSNSNCRVAGQLNLTSGVLNTGSNTLTALSNVVNNSGHVSSGAGILVFGGPSVQAIQSSGTANFGSIRISNSAGVNAEAPVSLTGTLNFTAGIFYINNHLLSLGSSSTISGILSSSSMIRLNGVTSDGGVRKSYPASASDFTFPVGVTLKYTPARINVTSNSVAGVITLKPVDTRHPATTDASNLELDYYWRVTSTGFNGSTVVNHTYSYESLDISGTEGNYVAGRFFGSLWAPTLGIAGTVDGANNRFNLNGVNYFDGDFTAGEPSEFNIITTFYSRNATSGGNWDDPNTWSIDGVLQHDGGAAPTFPNFNQAVIASGHTVLANGGSRNAVSVVVNGTLDLANTVAHNFGNVTGTGKIVQTPTAGNQYVFPGGDYSLFTSTGGGTFEFGGTINGTLSTQTVYNNLIFSGTATKNLPNANLTINGDLTIGSGILVNPGNRNINLAGNWVNTVGVGGFLAGTGIVNLNGTNQTLTGSTDFANLTTSSTGIKTLTSSITATSGLTLTSGVFFTGANQLTVNAGGGITGGSASSYVNGNLRRGVPAAATSSFFPIGDGSVYSPVTVTYTGTTLAGGFITANSLAGDHPQVYTSGVDQTKTANRYWTLTNSGVNGFTSYNAAFTYDAPDLDVSANPLNFIVARYSASTWTQPTVGTLSSNSTQGINISGTTFGDFQVGQSVGGKIWTGSVNTNWNLAGNWVPASVPGPGDNAIIGLLQNQPSFAFGGNGQCKDLVLLSGATVNIPSGYVLTVNENLVGTGNTISGVGSLNLNGASSTLSGSLTIDCNLTVNNSATLILGAGSTLNIRKNLTINGSINPNTLPVNFTGSDNSVISGNMGLYNLVVNKANSNLKVILGSNVTVSNQLNLQSGDLELNGFDLNLGTTGSLVNETDANCVIGVSGGSIQATRTLNAPSSLNVGGLGAVLSSPANLGSTQIIRKHNQVVFGIGFGINRRYEIHPTNNSSLNATFVFNYFDDELVTNSGTIEEGELDLWRFNGTTWEVQYATLNTTENTITKTGIPEFSEWTSGSEVNIPLNIDLAFVHLQCDGQVPVLKWRTLSETDSRTFVVEGSADGRGWEPVASVPAAGHSSEIRDYVLELKGVPDYIRQVRLTQTDARNEIQVFQRLPVNCRTDLPVRKISLRPNPNEGLFTLSLNGRSPEILDIQVVNTLGQVVGGMIHDASRKDEVRMDVRGLPAGVYTLHIRGEGSEPPTSLTFVVR